MVLDHFWGIAWGYVTVMVDELYHGDVPIIYRGVDHQKDMMVDLSNPWVQPGWTDPQGDSKCLTHDIVTLWCIGPAVANWSWTTSFKVFVYWLGSGKGRRSKAALPTTLWNRSAKDNNSERHQAGVCGWHVQVCRAGGASPKVPFINGGNPLATTRVTTRGTFQTIWVKPAHVWVEIPPMVILGMVYDCFNHITPKYWMVGGLEHEFYFSMSYGMSSFPLTHIFQMGRSTTNQIIIPWLTTIKPLLTIINHY